MQKKLLLLGGSRYLLPVIKTAHELGCHVITCDYLPDNVAHKYSDEYYNVSIIDKEAVLALAQKLKIDGVLSFACDPGVVTAAYVAETMGLPFQCSYRSTEILQNKGLFRKFLLENGFNSPQAGSYTSLEAALRDINRFTWPVIVKPVDSAGSKGVTKVETVDDLPEAVAIALENGHNGEFIIEDFLVFQGYHSSADAFTMDGKLVFCTYSDQLFDTDAANPYTPTQIIWPSSMKQAYQEELTRETQRLMTLLGMKSGIYNIETCVAKDKPYIMEVSPRGGGCKIAEIQKFATGVDLIEREVKQALGLPIDPIEEWRFDGIWCEFVIHNEKDQEGIFRSLTIDPNTQNENVRVIDLSVRPGECVEPFTGANKALGDMFLRFGDRETLNAMLLKTSDWLKINLAK